MDITIRLNEQQLRDVERKLSGVEKGAATAIMRGINRSLGGIRTDATAALFGEFTLARDYIFRSFELRQARTMHLVGSVSVSGSRVPLIQFEHSGGTLGIVGTAALARGLTARVTKKGGSSFYPHAFLQTTRKGYRGIFWRTKSEGGGLVPRTPIEQLYGPSLPSALGKPETLGPIETKAQERFEKNLNQQVRYLLEKGKV